MRRYTRRTQPCPAGAKALSHTSAAAASDSRIQVSGRYSTTLQGSLRRAQVEQETWAGEVLLVANATRGDKIEIRRQAQEEAHIQVERQWQEQQRIRDEKLQEQRARAAERQERQRAEMERIRREEEAVRRRREEERAAAEEARRRAAEEAERRRRERLRTCTVCTDDKDIGVMIQQACEHWYCRECLRYGFEAALTSRTPFQCCQQEAPITLITDTLQADFVSRYELMVLEYNTPNPAYCANLQCGAFIPPANYHGPDSARCSQCGTDTCRHCRTRDHVGRGCTTDQATEQVRALAAIVGWKACPSCGTMVEKNRGCLHMTCLPPCRHEFCWRCSGPWQQCRSTCTG